MDLLKDMLKMARSSFLANGPRDLRNEGGTLSGPAAPLGFIFPIAMSISSWVNGPQVFSPNDGDLGEFKVADTGIMLDEDVCLLLV